MKKKSNTPTPHSDPGAVLYREAQPVSISQPGWMSLTILNWQEGCTAVLSLVDVTTIPDDENAGHRSMAALTLLQKHIHQRDLAELVDRLAHILLGGYLSSSQVVSLYCTGWRKLRC